MRYRWVIGRTLPKRRLPYVLSSVEIDCSYSPIGWFQKRQALGSLSPVVANNIRPVRGSVGRLHQGHAGGSSNRRDINNLCFWVH